MPKAELKNAFVLLCDIFLFFTNEYVQTAAGQVTHRTKKRSVFSQQQLNQRIQITALATIFNV